MRSNIFLALALFKPYWHFNLNVYTEEILKLFKDGRFKIFDLPELKHIVNIEFENVNSE